MPLPPPDPPRMVSVPRAPQGIMEIDWPLFGELCRVLALRVYREYDPDIIVGIAKAGVIPAAIIASMLKRDFASMTVTRRTPDALPALVTPPPALLRGRRVLLVDETCDSGHTLRLALHEVRARQPAEVRTAVSFRTGPWVPDYHAMETDQAIILPWDHEVIEGEG